MTKKQPVNLEKDITLHRQRRHGISGARLIMGEFNKASTGAKAAGAKNDYVVAWVAPWQKNIRTYMTLKDREYAQLAFKLCAGRKPPPIPELRRDYQRRAVYKWEARAIDPYCPDSLTVSQMERVIKKVSDDYNLPPPALVFNELPEEVQEDELYIYENRYYEHDHEIYIEANTLSFLLHELAHMVDVKINRNHWADHGPSFVRTLITLAGRYQYWLDESELADSAREAGLYVAPPRRALNPPPKNGL